LHVHGGVVGSIDLDSIAHIVIPKRAAELFSEGDLVEITKGPFAGHKGLIEKMPSQKKEEIIVRITTTDNPITIKLHADYLKVLEKKIKEPVQREFKFGEAKELKASDLAEMANQAGFSASEGIGADADLGDRGEQVTASDQTKDTFIDFGDEDEEEDDDDTWGKFG
jgi:ribosomal protein L24